jgi:hypothetical protein
MSASVIAENNKRTAQNRKAPKKLEWIKKVGRGVSKKKFTYEEVQTDERRNK